MGYEDDLILQKKTTNAQLLIENGNECLNRLNNWLELNKLELAPEKSEMIIFRGTRDRKHAKFKIGNTIRTPQKNVKYLGIVLEQRL